MSKPPLERSVTVTGASETVIQLRQFGERAVDHATRQMRRTAERIKEKAKDYVPEDSEALKESIEVIENRGARNRLEFDVVVGGATASYRWYDTKIKDVNIDQYAWRVHEHYEDFAIKKSDKTKAKMEKFPGKVGSGFLRRAADEEQENLRKQLFDGFETIMKEPTK